MQENILSLAEVSKTFGAESNKQIILNNISLSIYKKDFTVIMGPSGAGKSTLLYVCSGMEKPTSGSILYKDNLLSSMNEKKMAKLRADDFGFVFQQANLVSNLTLEENIHIAGFMKKGNKEADIKLRTDNLLKQMNIKEERYRLPSEVSGGEAQRASVARAVINDPDIIFADEPTGALNKKNTSEVLNIFGSLHESGQSIVMVTHDIHAALRGNRIIYLEDGQIKGELTLGKYISGDERNREEKVQQWLDSMEW